MSRATACALIVTLKTKSPITVKQLAYECLTEESNARAWLYQLEKTGIVRRHHTQSGTGKSSSRSVI